MGVGSPGQAFLYGGETVSDSQKWLVFGGFIGFGWLLFLLARVLTPFAISALLAYLGDPLVDRLETVGLSRGVAVTLVFLVMILILILGLGLLIPLLETQISSLIIGLPQFFSWAEVQLAPVLEFLSNEEQEVVGQERIVDMLRQHWREAGGLVATILNSLSQSGLAIVGWVMNLVLIPVVTFYLMRDWDLLVHSIHVLLPRSIESTASHLARESNSVLGAFLRGQFTVMLVLGVVYSVGLWIVGLDLAPLIGMSAGLISFVPYLGAISGFLAAVVAAAFQFQDFAHPLFAALVFGIGQTLEGMLLTPLLVGDRIGLHPVAVIFAILAGGQLFGFLGILLALPVASVVMVLIRHGKQRYEESSLYDDGVKLHLSGDD